MNEIEKQIDATIKLLKNHYRTNIIVLVILFLLTMFKLTPFFDEKQMVNIIFERYIIVITIIAIPGILKLFANLLAKVSHNANTDFVINKYKRAFYIRLYLHDLCQFHQQSTVAVDADVWVVQYTGFVSAAGEL